MAHWERRVANWARFYLRDANSSSLPQVSQHKALRIPWRSRLHPRYLSHSKQKEFLSSHHFNLCQKRQHQRFLTNFTHPLPCGFHICLAQWHTLPREAQLLCMCLRYVFLMASSAGYSIHSEAVCVCVRVCVWFRIVHMKVLDGCKQPASARLHNVLHAENFKCWHSFSISQCWSKWDWRF